MKYTIEKVATLIGARRIGDTDADIRWILTDSRSLCFPEETLFFALTSERNDGHRYIPELYPLPPVPPVWVRRHPGPDEPQI